MPEYVRQEVAELGVRLVDDAYMAWFTAEVECEQVLQGWFEASNRGPETYFAYRAALDREEAAARDLQRLFELTGPLQDTVADRAGEVIK